MTPSNTRLALHLLDRLGYGPRPGAVDKVEARGVDRWIEDQLHPDSIRENDVLTERLAGYPELSKSAEELFESYPPPKKRTLPSMMAPPRDLVRDLAATKVLRAVYSERQLEEVLVDFWFNHFNVSANKDADRWLVLPYERDVLRPRVFGKFRELLGAVAHSPAMLVYLDNARSTVDPRYAPEGMQDELADMQRAMSKHNSNARLGLNENYARELMELHTLGVDGGYTQADVIALARILTGWTVVRPNEKNKAEVKDIAFRFARRMHDAGDKKFLNATYTWTGEDEGERALDALAKHPSTARHIALKLCVRFVADEPPKRLVEHVARRFQESGGDLRTTYAALFSSSEFRHEQAFRTKVKTPLEFLVSALRVTDAEIRDIDRIAGWLDGQGMPLYRCEPPTGYPDDAASWVNAGALLARLKAAQFLFSKWPKAPASATTGLDAALAGIDRRDGHAVLSRLIDLYLGGIVAPRTRTALEQRLHDPEISNARLDDVHRPIHADRLAMLVIGSPDFQRR